MKLQAQSYIKSIGCGPSVKHKTRSTRLQPRKLSGQASSEAPGSNLQKQYEQGGTLKFGVWSFSGCWSLVLGAFLSLPPLAAKPAETHALLLTGATVHTVSGQT